MKTKQLLIIAGAAAVAYLAFKGYQKKQAASNDYRVTGNYPSYTDTPQMNWSDDPLITKNTGNVVYL